MAHINTIAAMRALPKNLPACVVLHEAGNKKALPIKKTIPAKQNYPAIFYLCEALAGLVKRSYTAVFKC